MKKAGTENRAGKEKEHPSCCLTDALCCGSSTERSTNDIKNISLRNIFVKNGTRKSPLSFTSPISAPRVGLEPTTFLSLVDRSIHLSYRGYLIFDKETNKTLIKYQNNRLLSRGMFKVGKPAGKEKGQGRISLARYCISFVERLSQKISLFRMSVKGPRAE